MKKKNILVVDSKGFFLKMFKKKFKDRLQFSEDSVKDGIKIEDFDQSVFVVYEKSELIDFLVRVYKTEANAMVFFFNQHLQNDLFLRKEIKKMNLKVICSSKPRTEIFKDLHSFFFNDSSFVIDIANFNAEKN